MATYSYTSLSAGAFRLMKILPGHGEDPVVVTLDIHDLQTPPNYEALSYAWGDANDTCVVIVNNDQLVITRSLYSALCRLRRREEPRVVWADGICIDQSNVLERSQQVAQMNRIFGNATIVYAYLGEVAEGSEDVPMLLHEVMEALKAQEKAPSSSFQGQPNRERNSRRLSLFRVLSRRWFTRVWVLQEVVLAREVRFLCGSWEMSLDALKSLVDVCDNSGGIIVSNQELESPRIGFIDGVRLLELVVMLRETITSEGPSYGFLQILAGTRGMQASDARDHIFGIIGLWPEANDPELRPDYDVSPRALYIQIAKTLVGHGEGIQILHNVSPKGNNTCRHLPSWVPDWSLDSRPFFSVLPDAWGDEFGRSCFRAAGYTETHMMTSQDSSTLQVKGIVFDGITICLNGSGSAPRSDEEATLIALHAIDELSTLIGPSYPTGGDRSVVISHVATCGLRTREHFADPGCQISRAERREEFKPFLQTSRLLATLKENPSTLSSICGDQLIHHPWFLRDVAVICSAFRRAKSTRGYVGQVPLSTQVGDVIFVPFGSSVPMIIRPCGNDYTLVGASYIHGIMHGEALLLPDGKEETVTLV